MKNENLRELFAKMDVNEIETESLLVQTRIAKSTKRVADNLEKIAELLSNMKAY